LDKLNEDSSDYENDYSFFSLREKLTQEVDCKISYLQKIENYVDEVMKGLIKKDSFWILIKKTSIDTGNALQLEVNSIDIERYYKVC